MRVLVTGSRDWTDPDPIRDLLNGLLWRATSCDDHLTVIEGGAKGADAVAAGWADAEPDGAMTSEVLRHEQYPAHWRHTDDCAQRCRRVTGLAAGPIRNQQMLDEGHPDLVVAFHDDLAASAGTADMVARAKKDGLPVWVVSHG